MGSSFRVSPFPFPFDAHSVIQKQIGSAHTQEWGITVSNMEVGSQGPPHPQRGRSESPGPLDPCLPHTENTHINRSPKSHHLHQVGYGRGSWGRDRFTCTDTCPLNGPPGAKHVSICVKQCWDGWRVPVPPCDRQESKGVREPTAVLKSSQASTGSLSIRFQGLGISLCDSRLHLL